MIGWWILFGLVIGLVLGFCAGRVVKLDAGA